MAIDFKIMTPAILPAPFFQQRTMFLSRDAAGGPISPNYGIVAVSSGTSGYDAAVTTTCYLNAASTTVTIEVVTYEDAEDANLVLMNEQLVEFSTTALPGTGSARTYVLNATDDNLIQAVRVDGGRNVVILALNWTVKAAKRGK